MNGWRESATCGTWHPATRCANSRRSRSAETGCPSPPRSLRLSRRSHSAALPPTTTPHFPLAHECLNRDAQSRSARHHRPDSAPTQSWIGRRLFCQCLKDTGRAFCWHPETPGRGWKLTHGLRAGLVNYGAFALLLRPVPTPPGPCICRAVSVALVHPGAIGARQKRLQALCFSAQLYRL